MRLFKPQQTKLPLKQADFDAMADAFLVEHGFEVDAKHRALFGAFIQHSPEDSDSFAPLLLARRIRKQLANELAFYLIYPDKRPKPQAASGSEESKKADG